MRTEKDGAADDVKEFIQGNLQAAQNIHYALSTFCKLEKQQDRGDTEDLGEVIHPQLLGNEHWVLNVQCSSHCFTLHMPRVNGHPPAPAHLAGPCAPAPNKCLITIHL